MLRHGKIGLITGAGSGIGRAAAETLARSGAAGLVLVDLDASALAAVSEALSAEGLPVLVRAHDVRDADAWMETADAVRDRFGGLDFAVANAGVAHGATIVDQTFADWRRVLSVNLDGAFLTIQTALRLMRDHGAIVAVASASAVKAEPGTSAYAASKAGVVQLVKVAAREVAARGIRVNAILPGGVKTPIWREVPFFQDLAREAGDETVAFDQMAALATPLGRYAEAGEVAGLIAFLLSDAASTMTGTALVCDGGYSA
ncbi:SDR family oxidoreductase [Phenylobacterium sp. LjRoot219]|uniref:SDR family NAD(P)-dependent oxidoreductase n=1 Tax=Phenylobacterium sp. LjRoot219 TaxID=3342283 RepID=UPI003ECDCFFC